METGATPVLRLWANKSPFRFAGRGVRFQIKLERVNEVDGQQKGVGVGIGEAGGEFARRQSAGTKGIALVNMIPAEFHAADDVGPEVVLQGGGDFFTKAIVRVNFIIVIRTFTVREVVILTPEVERELVRGLKSAIEARNPTAVVMRIIE